VLVPGVVTMSNAFLSTLKEHEGLSLIAPRSNPKTAEFAIPAPLPFNFLGLSAIVIWVKSPSISSMRCRVKPTNTDHPANST
jgi:uncharacterized membrane protein